MVAGLKAAGAVIMGKTTTTEFGWKSPGDCPLHGITRNPGTRPTPPADPRPARRGRRGRVRAAAYRHRRRRVDPHPRRVVRAGRLEADLRPHSAMAARAPSPASPCAGPMTRTVRDAALMFVRHGALGPARPVLPPRRARDWRDGIEDGVAGLTRRRAATARASSAGRPGRHRRGGARRATAGDAGATWKKPTPACPTPASSSARVWGAALARLVADTADTTAACSIPGIREVARRLGGMTAIEFMDAEAIRADRRPRHGRLHQRYDLVLCPTVPAGPPLADAPTIDPVRALWTEWAPWTFTFNLTRQPAITVPMGLRRTGCRTRCRSRRRSFATTWCSAPPGR